MIRTDSRLKLIRGPVQCSSNSMHSLGLGRSHPFKGSEGLFLPQKCMVIMPGLQLLCIALHYRSYQLPNSGETRSSLHPSLGHYHHIEQCLHTLHLPLNPPSHTTCLPPLALHL